MNIDEIKAYYRAALHKLDDAKEEVAQAKQAILDYYQQEINDKLFSKEEPFGTVNVDDVSFNIPKRVKWNQEGLAKMYKKIGEGADEYIKVSYDISESKYKSWPKNWREDFEPLRDVVEGSISVKLK